MVHSVFFTNGSRKLLNPGINDTGMTGNELTYASSGVDIDRDDNAVKSLVSKLVFRRQGIGSHYDLPGSFAGGVEFGNYILSMCTDGVGTKLMIADAVGKWDTVGIDCMAMNVNDLICIGAEPIAFVDYIAIDVPADQIMEQIGIGLNRAAELANVSIVGGETATLPEIVTGFDLAGTALGIVRKDKIVTGKDVREGDVIIGLESTGLHSNGYSLVRKVVEVAGLSLTDRFPDSRRSIGEVFLEPTRIYVRDIMPLLDKFEIHGMANITGGGLMNIPRINPTFGYEITDPLPAPDVFGFLQEKGDISAYEMYRTFNMGMGFTIVAPEQEAQGIISSLDCKAKVVGTVKHGNGIQFRELDYSS